VTTNLAKTSHVKLNINIFKIKCVLFFSVPKKNGKFTCPASVHEAPWLEEKKKQETPAVPR